jgi:RNA polymerase sigma factor (TIGR02999 family)
MTVLLERARAGGEGATDELLPLVYDELRRLARARLGRERPGQTLQPTGLVHEAYLRLLGENQPPWQNRRHFFAAAAEAMRRILVERARRVVRLKRGGALERVSLGAAHDVVEPRLEEMLDLDRALERLAERDAEMAEVVKLRYFAGLTVEETGAALGSSPRSVNRTWAAARAWLLRELQRPAGRPATRAP